MRMDPLSATLREITEVLNRIGRRYAIGGSIASSARSIWRSTAHVDLIAAMLPAQAEAFVNALGKDWYADVDEIRGALTTGRAFNVIQMKNAQKIDIFPAREAFQSSQIERATVLALAEDKVSCMVTTAEDILLAKLRWYNDGGRVSERRWNDIVSLLAINNPWICLI